MYCDDKGVRENWRLFFILGHFIDFQYLLVGLLISLYIGIAFKITEWKGGKLDLIFLRRENKLYFKKKFQKGVIIS